MAVFGVIDALGGCAENVDALFVETHGQVVGYLAAYAQDCAVGLLKVEDIHHALECELVEIETVTHVVVGRHCLRIVVDHHRAPSLFLDGHKGIYGAPVELYR